MLLELPLGSVHLPILLIVAWAAWSPRTIRTEQKSGVSVSPAHLILFWRPRNQIRRRADLSSLSLFESQRRARLTQNQSAHAVCRGSCRGDERNTSLRLFNKLLALIRRIYTLYEYIPLLLLFVLLPLWLPRSFDLQRGRVFQQPLLDPETCFMNFIWASLRIARSTIESSRSSSVRSSSIRSVVINSAAFAAR